ncbi:MAG: hypothetical protein WBW88_20085 [Rhodothermales bacterium]
MRMLTALLPVLLLTSGCVSTQWSNSNDREFVDKINRRGRKETATIVTRDGQTLKGRALRIEGDSVSYLNIQPDVEPSVGRIASDQVASIRFKSSELGMLYGIGFGAALGFGAGVLLAVTCDGWLCPPPAKAGALFALPGALLGGITGALVGTDNRFELLRTANHPE